jgi:hypothetical protein
MKKEKNIIKYIMKRKVKRRFLLFNKMLENLAPDSSEMSLVRAELHSVSIPAPM